MLKPKRTDAPRWRCAACGVTLGRVGLSTGREYMLYPSADLTAARPDQQQPQTWWLTCPAGHETEWHGIGIKWFTRAAA